MHAFHSGMACRNYLRLRGIAIPSWLTDRSDFWFDTIAGKWEGLSKRLPDMQDDAWVILISARMGTFTSQAIERRGFCWGPALSAFMTVKRSERPEVEVAR